MTEKPFACEICLKKYASKGSLSRHSNNHAPALKYSCSICRVDFGRSDLLKRHMQIHDPESSATSQWKPRLRARTACETCKGLKIKCSGRRPCTECYRRDKTCLFSKQGDRASRDNMIESITTPSPVSNSTIPAVSLGPCSPATPNLGIEPVNQGTSRNLDMDSVVELAPFSTSGLTWPWLHENLFLQQEAIVNLDYLDFEVQREPIPNHQDNVTPRLEGSIHTTSGDLGELNDTYGGTQEQLNLINSIIETALQSTNGSADNTLTSSLPNFRNESKLISQRLVLVFDICSSDFNIQSADILDNFVDLYMSHFYVLWPLFPKHNFSTAQLHPLLFLVLGSIGAMYGGKESSLYATLMHAKLRDLLSSSLFEFITYQKEALAIGQARSLTQAVALYFGQKKAFTYAQHVGSVLIAQARRMDLFSTVNHIQPNSTGVDEIVDHWLIRESRKRLAIAIVRLEMYTSVLLSARPLITPEEVDVEMPCSRFLWETNFQSNEALAQAIAQDFSLNKPVLLFSDILRIVEDDYEELPPLNILEKELVFLGIQQDVWMACKAQKSITRLTQLTIQIDTGLEDQSSSRVELNQERTSPGSLDDYIVQSSRQMRFLQQTLQRTPRLLRKLRSCRSQQDLARKEDRSSLLTCLLLYHLSFLRLHAPIEILHEASYRVEIGETTNEAWIWSHTPSAGTATRHALKIFDLLRGEAKLDDTKRAHLNFLTFVGLYHAAATIWYFSGSRKVSEEVEKSGLQIILNGKEVPLIASNTSQLMNAFADIFNRLNPAWSTRSSFSAAAKRLGAIDPVLSNTISQV